MESVNIEYLPKLNDYLEAYSLYESKTPLKKVDKIVAVSLIIIGIIFLSIIIAYDPKIIYIICGMAFIITGILEFFGKIDPGKIIVKYQFKKSDKLKHLQKIKFNDVGLEYETQGINSRIEWSIYKKYYEGENIFILIYGKRQYSVIPKYPFKKDDLNNFRNLLEEKIT